MEQLRIKLDNIYSPWITKIIAIIVAFYGTYKLAEVGPLSPTASLIAAAIAALFCLWNPGGAAIVYIIVLFISAIHINSAMVGLIFMVLLIYCTLGYASVSIMILTPLMVILPLPDGAYWGVFVMAMFFAYRCKEHFVSFLYPIFTTLILIAFGKFGTAPILYPGGFELTQSLATDIDSFIATITFDADSQYIMPNIGLIIKLMVFIIIAGAVIWAIFKNTWIRTKIKNLDICEAVMFAISIIIIILLDMAVSSTLGLATATSYGVVIISIIASFVVTRPFASEKVAETLISKVALKNRKDAALKFVAVKPKVQWETTYVNEKIKAEIKGKDKALYRGFVIQRDSNVNASYVVDIIAGHYGANIIKIDHDVFDKLYGEEREKNFNKIFEDAIAQEPSVICFNDAEKFFYKIDETSGEYVKRYNKIYMSAVAKIKESVNVHLCLITKDISLIDESLKENGVITDTIDYKSDENEVPITISKEVAEEEDKQTKKKTNRASAIAIIIFLLAVGGLLYYLFVYENQQYDISEAESVETTLIDYAYSEDDEVGSINNQITDIMMSNDAMFYYVEKESYGQYAVYQTNEATFNEMSVAKKGTMLKKMCKSTESLFNSSYDSLPALPLSDENNTNTVFNGHLKMHGCAQQLDTTFDGLENFFIENELVLSCDGMSALKLAYLVGDEEEYVRPAYYGIIEGYVTTEAASSNVSWVDFLAPVGETSHVQIGICATYDPDVIQYGCDAIMIENID